MKRSILFICLSSILLFACNKDNTSPSFPDQSLSLRTDEMDCTDFCNLSETTTCCDNFSNCADLAGTRAISIELGPPPITFTGQKPTGESGTNFAGICSNPADGHPFSFRLTGGFDGSAAVVTATHLGRLKSVAFDICVRPYIQENFAPIPAFLQPLPFELYPPCHDLVGDYVLTAANGHELWLQVKTDGYPNCDNEDFYLLEGQWTITGGTGRFANASGGGCITGSGWANLFDPNPGAPDKWFLEGGIDY